MLSKIAQFSIFRPTRGRLIRTLAGRGYHLVLSLDGKHLFSAGGMAEYGIKIWDLDNGKEPPPLRGHTDMVLSLALSPDGKQLASGSTDKTIRVWDVKPEKKPIRFAGTFGAFWV